MREYKFRAKAIEPMADGNQWIENGFGVYIADRIDGVVECVLYTPFGTYHVDPATVGQYTGLKDKNGKEIYEGDVIKWTFEELGEDIGLIVFDKCFQVKVPRIKELEGISGWYENADISEVLGSIHDNPELLEG